MSSIMTNAGAMTALQTLKATNKNLEITQGRISTGSRVSEAAHNAAYWSIATTMRSDNNAMSTVSDALGLGAAQVDIAYTAMDAVKDTIDKIKSKLVAASEPDVDKSKIQSEIEQLQNDLKTYAKSATFSGGNWLDVQEASVEKIVASFIRGANGSISLGTIDVDTSKTALINATPGQLGLLQTTISVTPGAETIELSGLGTPTSIDRATVPPTSPSATIADFDTIDWQEDDQFKFSVTVNGIASAEFTITADNTGAFDFNTALSTIFPGPTNNISAYVDGSGALVFSGGTAVNTITVTGLSANTGGGQPTDVSVLDLKITDLNRQDLQGLLNHVDKVLGTITTAASDLGAIKTRIASQQNFVSKIMDAVSRGVGQLVDADMEQESTRLQALQVQQQLGIQALSIANGNAQNILALFKG